MKNIDYPDQTNRAFVYLIEASKRKIPLENSWGNEMSYFDRANEGSIYGHVARNIRMSLKFAEIMNPFLIFEKI